MCSWSRYASSDKGPNMLAPFSTWKVTAEHVRSGFWEGLPHCACVRVFQRAAVWKKPRDTGGLCRPSYKARLGQDSLGSPNAAQGRKAGHRCWAQAGLQALTDMQSMTTGLPRIHATVSHKIISQVHSNSHG